MQDIATVAHDWSAVADAWDTHIEEVDEHTASATAALLERLAVRHGERVLELAAGPGTVGATWSRLVGPEGSVTLSDLAPAMVDVAVRRNAGFGNVSVRVLDASAIDCPDASFDVVACRMGLMFTPDPAVAFGDIHRVLAPGGRFAALTWASIEHNPWLTCLGMAVMINGLGSGPPVGPGEIFSLSDPGTLRALAGDAGFIDVHTEELAVTFRAANIDEHIARVSSLAGPLAGVLAAASAEQRSAVHRSATDLATPYLTDDGLTIPGRALLVSGSR